MKWNNLIKITFFLQLIVPTLLLKQFNGERLVLAGYHYPPYDNMIRHPDGNYTIYGSNMNATEWVMTKINTTYSILPVNDPQEIATLGYYEAAFSKLITKKADALVPCVAVDPSRAERMDYTSGLGWSEPYDLVVPKPEFQSRLFAFVRPFQPLVWLGLFLSIAIVTLMMVMLTSTYQNFPLEKGNKTRNDPEINPVSGSSYFFIYVMNIMTNHGTYTSYMQHSFRILAGGLLLASLVLVNSYSSIVTSSLTVPIRNPAVNSLEDLVDNKDVSLIIQKNTIIGMFILKAETGLFKKLGDELRRHPDRMVMDYPTTLKFLYEGKYAFSFVSSFNRNIIVKQYQKDGKCRLQLSDPLRVSSGSFFALGILQKGSKYRDAWSHALMYLWETGLVLYWVDQTIPNTAEACFDKRPTKTTAKPIAIKLIDLTSAFLILGIGLGSAAICLTCELIYNRLISRK